MKFLLVCGGTAGHINPALSIASEIRDRMPESEILFAGADREMEKRLIPEAGYDLVNIKMSGLSRGFRFKDIVHNIKTVWNTIAANRKSKTLLKRFMPDAVIGTGGYICYPVLKKAAGMRIPTFIHESNAYPGLTVKMLSPIVNKVLVAFKGHENMYKKPENVVHTGTPVRSEFNEPAEADGITGPKDKQLVVTFWGSLGAERMNEMMPEFIKANLENNCFNHIHATGSSSDQLKKRLHDLGVTGINPPAADIRDYIDDMPTVMKAADLVLCRAGGITIAELIALGKPAILIPSQYVPDNIQPANARQLQNAGGALVIPEKECTGETLYKTVAALLADRDKLNSMALAQKSLSVPNAASRIVDIVLRQCRNDEPKVE